MSPSQTLEEAVNAFQRGNLDRAREIAGHGLAEEPTPQLQHLMGLIDCRSGTLDSGVEWLRQASDAEPENIGFRIMLVRALIDSGRPAEALEAATPPAGTTPAELALWHARAEAADGAEDYEVSVDAWGRLCSARDGDWRAWANFGESLARLDLWPEAVAALRRALLLNPQEQGLRRNLSSALTQAGLYAEAAEELERILDAGPDDVLTRLTLARLFADLARNGDAVAQLDQASFLSLGEPAFRNGDSGLIRIAIGQGERRADDLSEAELDAVRELALILERSNRLDALRLLLNDAEEIGISTAKLAYPAAAIALRDGDARSAKQLLELESVETRPIRWYRLMAKIADSLGDTASAMAAAEAMNRCEKDFDDWVRRGAAYSKRMHALAQATTPQWAALLRPLETGQRPAPAFLVGFPRSGTTLLDTFLMGHPGVRVLEELHMMIEAEKMLGHTADLPRRSKEDLERARDAYFAELDRHVGRDFAGLVVDKLPLNMVAIAKIHCLFPDARIIFAQRHPCDVVLSGFMQSFSLNDAMGCFLTIEGAADLYDAAMQIFSRSRDALPLAVHDLVYERLVADPEAQLRPLIEFLGLEWQPEMLDYRATAQARGVINTPSYDQVTQPLNKVPSGRWKRYEKQLDPVLPILLRWAERLGYAN